MQAPDQQLMVLNPVTEVFEAAHLPIASLEQATEPEDSASDSKTYARLPWAFKELPLRARDRLLRLPANPRFSAKDITWTNAAELDAFLDGGAQVSLWQVQPASSLHLLVASCC